MELTTSKHHAFCSSATAVTASANVKPGPAVIDLVVVAGAVTEVGKSTLSADTSLYVARGICGAGEVSEYQTQHSMHN